ncbi:MAG: PilN domain-containing protein [Phycisphaerales bacterium]|nr:PilN domain-containing protein [Phycisphaerales bacterium]
MTRAGSGQDHPHRVAGIREHAGRLWLVALQNRTGLAVLESRSLDARDSAGLRDILHRHRVEEVVRLAPAAETICKSVSVPAGDPDAVASALALMAEAQLPDALPRHRRASGAIPDVDRHGQKSGLLTGWRAGSEPVPLDGDTEERWTTVPAALAVLSGTAPVAAARDAGVGSGGAVSIIVRGPTRTLARVLITEREADFGAAVHETAQAAGVGADGRADGDLWLDERARASVAGVVSGLPADGAWLREYGLALGAAMVAVGSRGLTDLSASAPGTRTGAVERTLDWLSIPGRAPAVIAAAVALMLLVPLGVSWGRSAVLASRAGALDESAGQLADLDRQAALYEALDQSRWPMTKLLADIAAATPVGVVLDSVRLSPETGVGLDGTAPSPEHIEKMQAAFNKTGLFRDLRIDRQESTDAGVKFSVSAKVASPHVRVADAEDFAGRSLAVRLYGDGASNTAYSASSAHDTGRQRARAERAEREDGSGDGAPRSPDRPAASGPATIPPPLSDADIEKLDATAAGKRWAEYKSLIRTLPAADAATRDRLSAEADKLFARFKAAQAPAPAGGGT